MKQFGFILTFCSLFFLLSFGVSKNDSIRFSPYQAETDSLKTRAFQILESHCNECHLKKKPAYVFTYENMNAFTAIINIQVFVKKKMPKGKAYPLTGDERKVLNDWVVSQLE